MAEGTCTRRQLLAGIGVSAIAPRVAGLDAAAAAPRPEQSAGGKRLTLLHFADTHAQLETHQEYLPGAAPDIQMMGGYARLKTAIERQRTHCEGPCFLLDGGDEFQGSGPAAWSQGEVVLEPLRALGSNAFTPGNWEPAYGPERFKDTMARLGFPVVCYNFHDRASGNRLFPPSFTLERQGVKLAIVGVTDIGADYVRTLAAWRTAFLGRLDEVRALGFDERFIRMWDYYLALSEAGFATGISQDLQIAMEKSRGIGSNG